MKVCPSCNSRFAGGETFCPHDGEKLVDSRDLSPGQMTGAKLANLVRLDRLAYADGVGERYFGRLLESRRAVFVTVFAAEVDLADQGNRRFETARAAVGTPLPAELITLHRTHVDEPPAFVVESDPRGPSLREILEERGSLRWDEAARIVCNVARVIEWLAEHGVIHYSLHPGAIYVTNLKEGRIQLGEWALEAALVPGVRESGGASDADTFVGYAATIAPELIEGTGQATVQASIYALGCMLYELATGKPMFGVGSPREVLKRHLHEKPVKLQIALGAGELHPNLDDVLDMLVAKDPSKRFQAPLAVIAALANLLGEAPNAVAPPLVRADEQDEDDLFSTIDMSSVDRASLPPISGPKSKVGRSTYVGPPGGLEDAVSAALQNDQNDEADFAAPKLKLGNLGARVARSKARRLAEESEASEASEVSEATDDAEAKPAFKGIPSAAHLAASFADDEVVPAKQTLLFASGVVAQAKASGVGLDANGLPVPDADDATDRVDVSASLLAEDSKATEEPADSRPTDEMAAIVDESQIPTQPTVPVQVEAPAEETPEEEKPTLQLTNDAAESLVAEAEPAAEAVAAAAVAPAAERPNPVANLQIGFTEVDATRDIDRSDWFAGSTEDAWEATLDREHQERTERKFKVIIGVVIAALVLGVAALFVWAEWLAEPTDTPEAEEVGKTEPTPEAGPDLDALYGKFDAAMTEGRLVAPIGDSALHALEELKRHDASSERFAKKRSEFVERAREEAKKLDAAGDLRAARSHAGYASQFAPEDAELKAMTADLQARFTGVPVESEARDAGAGEEADAGTAQDAGTDAAAPEEAPEPVEEAPDKTPDKKQRKPTASAKAAKKAELKKLLSSAKSELAKGNVGAAQNQFEAALAIDSSNHEVHAGLGKVYFEKGKYAEAAKHQARAVRGKPKRNDYRIALGQSYFRLGRYAEAIEAWEVVLQRDPDNRYAKQYIALARNKLK